jgi:hypothetical protein
MDEGRSHDASRFGMPFSIGARRSSANAAGRLIHNALTRRDQPLGRAGQDEGRSQEQYQSEKRRRIFEPNHFRLHRWTKTLFVLFMFVKNEIGTKC